MPPGKARLFRISESIQTNLVLCDANSRFLAAALARIANGDDPKNALGIGGRQHQGREKRSERETYVRWLVAYRVIARMRSIAGEGSASQDSKSARLTRSRPSSCAARRSGRASQGAATFPTPPTRGPEASPKGATGSSANPNAISSEPKSVRTNSPTHLGRDEQRASREEMPQLIPWPGRFSSFIFRACRRPLRLRRDPWTAVPDEGVTDHDPTQDDDPRTRRASG